MERHWIKWILATCALALLLIPVLGPAIPALQSWGESGPSVSKPWRTQGMPRQSKPYTRFSLEVLDGQRVLRVEADKSYGNLVHDLHLPSPKEPLSLAWRWRVDQLVQSADLSKRALDDTALKVCVMFDMPIDRMPFVQRQLYLLYRSQCDDALPSATVCYVWGVREAIGSRMNNAFTGRIRYFVLQNASTRPGQWLAEQRDVVADFKTLFGDESPAVPTIIGLAIGADADNTRERSLGYVADLQFSP